MIRVIYISRINLLSDGTNVYNLAKTCEAMNAQEDFRVKLVTTDHDRNAGAFFKMVGVHQPFDITCLSLTSTLSRHSGKRWHELFIFLIANLRLVLFLLRRTGEFDVVYFRDESLFPTAIYAKMILRKKVFFEIHSVWEGRLRQLKNTVAVRFADGVIAISSGLKRYYQKTNNAILISVCSAAEDSWFNFSKDKHSFRRQLGLPIEAFLIGYTGVVGANANNDYYEVDDIIRSLASLPEKVLCVIVGELNDNAQWLRKVAEKTGVQDKVIIVPWRERSEIPKYLQAFDVILIPKRKKDLVGDSPAKMFPALAARRPIIGGHAECIEEVLTDGMDAVVVKNNSPEGWKEAILKIYESPDFAEKIAGKALETSKKYTWEARGRKIAAFIRETVSHGS